jgi:hypothetical protein
MIMLPESNHSSDPREYLFESVKKISNWSTMSCNLLQSLIDLKLIDSQLGSREDLSSKEMACALYLRITNGNLLIVSQLSKWVYLTW